MSKLFTIAEGLENMGAIKTGGQGSVYKGKRIGEIITAIKLLPTPVISQNEEDKHYSDFKNEVTKLERVTAEPNPNVVKILSSGVSETGCFPYIEMEFIEGPDLGELLKPPHSSVFTIKEIIKVADQLSNALAHCHKLNVKHGDIKSNNVKYNQHTGNYVLIDFGLAILSEEERRTSLRRAGAIEFMAPEQNEGIMLFETDVYSFGIILYELLAGQVPFPLDGNSETARNKVMVAHMETPPPDVLQARIQNLPMEWDEEQKAKEAQVPEWIISLVYKCLEKDPADRYANGEILHDDICHQIAHAEHATSVMDGDSRLALLQKDKELKDLNTVIARQEKELAELRNSGDGFSASKKVSKKTFSALLACTLLLGCLCIYSFFFIPRTASAVSPDAANQTTFTDSSSVDNSASDDGEENKPSKRGRVQLQNQDEELQQNAEDEVSVDDEPAIPGEKVVEEHKEPEVKKQDTAAKKDTPAENKVSPPKKEIDTTGTEQ